MVRLFRRRVIPRWGLALAFVCAFAGQPRAQNSCYIDNGFSSYPAGESGTATTSGNRLYWVGGYQVQNATAKEALRQAVEAWNAELAGTGLEMRFSPDTGGDVSPAPSTSILDTGGAAQYNPNNNNLLYHEDLHNASFEGLKKIFMHELGHYLGLDENQTGDPNSIMRQCPGPTAAQCAQQMESRQIQQADWEKARDCLADNSDPIDLQDPGYEDTYEDTWGTDPEDHICYTVELVVTTWYCVGGYCSRMWEDRYPIHHFCEPLED